MAITIHSDSHVDHGLSKPVLDYLINLFSDRDAFFIETVELPAELDAVPCDLYGPLVGLPPVPESEVLYAKRGDREWDSRIIECAWPRTSRLVTVIAGPHDGLPCVLFTAYGGPLAPQEPGDPRCKDLEASKMFWRDHALIRVVDV